MTVSPDKLPNPDPAEGTNARPTVSILQAAALMGVSRRTVYNRLTAGKVKHKRLADGTVRIYTDTLKKKIVKPAMPNVEQNR